MKKTLGITVSSALLIGLSSTAAHAEQNLFAMQDLVGGYQLIQTDGGLKSTQTAPSSAIVKGKEGKCGEAKCGEGKCGTKK